MPNYLYHAQVQAYTEDQLDCLSDELSIIQGCMLNLIDGPLPWNEDFAEPLDESSELYQSLRLINQPLHVVARVEREREDYARDLDGRRGQ